MIRQLLYHDGPDDNPLTVICAISIDMSCFSTVFRLFSRPFFD